MRIHHIRIENFGVLSDYDLDLREGSNVILQDNGRGKSTLAAFIRCMFYGLEGARKKDLSENDRMRYQPWNRGHFGGEIVFESNGKNYTLIRDFGSRDADMTFGLFDTVTGLPSTDFSANIGVELFGIDSESFRKTSFIAHDLLKYDGVNSTISSKVSALSQTNDLNNYDAVEGQLKDYLNANSPKKKNGGLYQLNEEIRALDEEVKKRKSLEDQLAGILSNKQIEKDEEAELKAQRVAALKEQETLGEQKSKIAAMQAVKRLYEETKVRFDRLDSYFKKNVPAEDEIKKAQDDCDSVKDLLKEKDSLGVEIESKRKAATAMDTAISELRKDKEAKEEKRARLIVENQKKKDEIELAKARFENEKKAYEEAVAAFHKKQKEYEEKLHKAEELRALAMAKKKPSTGMLVTGVAVTLIGVLGLILGLVNHYPMFLSIASAVLIVLGILLLVLTFVSAKPDMSNLPELPKAPVQMPPTPPVIPDILQSQPVLEMPQDTSHYDEDIAKQKEAKGKCEEEIKVLQERLANDDSRISALEAGVKEFLGRYDLPYSRSGAEDLLDEMKSRLSEYREVFSQKVKQEEELERMRAEMAGAESTQPFVAVGETLSGVSETESPVVDTYTCDERIELLNAKLRSIQEKLDEKAAHISMYERTLENTYQQLEGIDEIRERRDEKAEKYEEMKRRYELLTKTREYLQKSKESFIARFMSPIKDSFDKYYEIMASKDAEPGEFRVDADMNFFKKEEGAFHSVHAQSEGYSDMIGICIRFALLDVMYKDERPAVIMDDPFVNLDADHLQGAKEFLEEVAKEYQIIYFTCHEDRV